MASWPQAGGRGGHVCSTSVGLPVTAGQTPGTLTAWGFEVRRVCLNLPAWVDAAEDVCLASVWLSLPQAVGERVGPGGCGCGCGCVCPCCGGTCLCVPCVPACACRARGPGSWVQGAGTGTALPGLCLPGGHCECEDEVTTHTHTHTHVCVGFLVVRSLVGSREDWGEGQPPTPHPQSGACPGPPLRASGDRPPPGLTGQGPGKAEPAAVQAQADTWLEPQLAVTSP